MAHDINKELFPLHPMINVCHSPRTCLCVSVGARARMCMRACVCACVCMYVRACVCVFIMGLSQF